MRGDIDGGGYSAPAEMAASLDRIECIDISNLGGKQATGSLVVLTHGQPDKGQYRKFRIRIHPPAGGPNDVAMIAEVLTRRLDHREWNMPDLLVIDGGKGQLSAVLEVMKEAGVDSIPCASIAKENEAIFLPGVAEPILLPPHSAALYFLQRVRDEAHRFALGYYHKVRRRESFASTLDSIPGIGAKRKGVLLQKFGSVKGIRQATVEELTAVKGMTRSVAERVKEYL